MAANMNFDEQLIVVRRQSSQLLVFELNAKFSAPITTPSPSVYNCWYWPASAPCEHNRDC